MSINYEDPKFSGKYVYLPRIGERAKFEIVEIYETKSENPKYNFHVREKVALPDGREVETDKDLGYRIEAKLKNGKTLVVSSLGAFHAVFRAHKIQDGETISVNHIDRGEWKVERE